MVLLDLMRGARAFLLADSLCSRLDTAWRREAPLIELRFIHSTIRARKTPHLFQGPLDQFRSTESMDPDVPSNLFGRQRRSQKPKQSCL